MLPLSIRLVAALLAMIGVAYADDPCARFRVQVQELIRDVERACPTSGSSGMFLATNVSGPGNTLPFQITYIMRGRNMPCFERIVASSDRETSTGLFSARMVKGAAGRVFELAYFANGGTLVCNYDISQRKGKFVFKATTHTP